MAEAYTLHQVNTFIKRTLALNFPQSIWIQAEIAQIRASRGHIFIELVEKSVAGNEIIAQSSAVIWSRNYNMLRKKLGTALEGVLTDGMAVMMKCQVSYHERYGLKFHVDDVQVEYTLGKLAKERAETIKRLQKEKLMDKNRSLPTPIVFQRLAVISSVTAAGYQDFHTQLSENHFGYSFKLKLFPAAMQGENAEREIVEQLINIQESAENFDAVVIIRGGGAKLDLVAFDAYAIAAQVAHMPIPVLSGIGHDIDETVLDLVSFRGLKTPTAVADFVIVHNQNFEAKIMGLAELLQQATQVKIASESSLLQQRDNFFQMKVPHLLSSLKKQLQSQTDLLKYKIPGELKAQRQRLEYLQKNIAPSIKNSLTQLRTKLEHQEAQLKLLSPEATLKRGYSITLFNGKSVSKKNKPKKNDVIETTTSVGTLISTIDKIEK